MQDLNSTMFYKANFNVTANDSTTDILWLLVLEIKNWLTGKWNIENHQIVCEDNIVWTSFKFGSRIFDQEQTNHVYGESVRYEDEEEGTESWACKIVEKSDPKESFAPREWTTEIGYQASGNSVATISYVVTYNDMPGFIGLCEEAPGISVPRVITSLFSNSRITCTIGPTKLSTDPVWLNLGDYPIFEKEVFSSEREIPIIYISPCQEYLEDNELRKKMLVNPFMLAKSVAGNAIVYCSNDTRYADEMRWYIDNRYSCYGGAIRVYRPQINTKDPNDRYRHRYINASFIQEYGEEAVYEIFRRAFAQDVHYYETMFRLETCKELIEGELRNQRLKALRSKSETEVDEAYQAFIDESERRELAEQNARAYKDDLEREKSYNYNLQVQLEALRETAEQTKLIESASKEIRGITEYPNTPQAIAKYFEKVYPDRIAFTERAYRSMVDCVTKNDYLWEVFYHIVIDLYDLLHDNPAQAFKEFSEQTGWDCSRGQGKMTRVDKDLMRQYIDHYNGQEINIEAHIKNGNKDNDPKSVRIYFAYDPQVTDKIIIGHCGKHLDNYSTRKAK